MRASTCSPVSPGAVMGIATGSPASGVDGFRRSHEEAGDAYVVARRMGRSVVGYGEVSIEALAIQNEAAARRFVTHALGDLEGEGRRIEVLRDTLRAYYRHGQNGAATAQDLEVHEQTVARRLASAAAAASLASVRVPGGGRDGPADQGDARRPRSGGPQRGMSAATSVSPSRLLADSTFVWPATRSSIATSISA